MRQGKSEDSQSAVNFLKLLDYLRTVFLQDIVLFRRRFPSHVVFKHPILRSPEFIEWEKSMFRHLDAPKPPTGNVTELLQKIARLRAQLKPNCSCQCACGTEQVNPRRAGLRPRGKAMDLSALASDDDDEEEDGIDEVNDFTHSEHEEEEDQPAWQSFDCVEIPRAPGAAASLKRHMDEQLAVLRSSKRLCSRSPTA